LPKQVKKDEAGREVPINEVPIYANCEKDILQYEPTDKPLFLSGLYLVLLDLDNDISYGDLNTGDIIVENPELAGKFFKADFWFAVQLDAWKNADFEFAELASDVNNIDSISVTGTERWTITVTLTDGSSKSFDIILSKKPASGKVTTTDVEAMTDAAFVAKNL